MTPAPLAIALNRFGLGARPDEPAPADARRWLLAQFDRYDPRPAVLAAVGPGAPLGAEIRPTGLASRDAARLRANAPATVAPGLAATPPASPMGDDPYQALRRRINDRLRAAVNARLAHALVTPTPFAERLVAFWSNHFAISTEKVPVQAMAPDFEADAIRPHIFGRFADMLLAVERHPAMLFYLDQTGSAGPNSPRAIRVSATRPERRTGLNENLAREILELHTLGVRSGYSQGDVTEFARALTGWAVDEAGRNGTPTTFGFVFREGTHEPGTRTVLGRAYPQAGEAQAAAVLQDLALAPATARHLATKLARHFVADDPPPALVARLSAAFLASGGDLPTLYRTLIDSPEAWQPGLPKFKTPWDWTVSALRGLGRQAPDRLDALPTLRQLGQPIWRPGQPAGFDDLAATWAAPDALFQRLGLAQRFVALAGPGLDARMLGPRLLPGTLSAATAMQLAQAESGPTALALLLVSPEFQRR